MPLLSLLAREDLVMLASNRSASSAVHFNYASLW